MSTKNIPAIIPQVGSGEDNVYAALPLPFEGVDITFMDLILPLRLSLAKFTLIQRAYRQLSLH